MTDQTNSNIIKFLDTWSKLAGLVAVLLSAIAFVAESFWLSIATIITGWALVSWWLIRIILKRKEIKNIQLPSSYQEKSYAFSPGIRLMAIIGVATLTIATGTWIWIGVNLELQNSSFPVDTIELPSANFAGLSFAVEPWISSPRLINTKIDRSIISQEINDKDILRSGEYSPVFTETNLYQDIGIIITGKSINEPTQISNKIPIKILSYEPISDYIDIIGSETGGPGNAWIMTATISDKSLHSPEQITWATIPTDYNQLLADAKDSIEAFGGIDNLGWPSEIVNAAKNNESEIPDFFLLENNERMVISLATKFEKPGIYTLQVGVEYIYKNKRSIAWTNQNIKVYVIGNYYMWFENYYKTSQNLNTDIKEYNLSLICDLHSITSYGYKCSKSNETTNSFFLRNTGAFSPDGQLFAIALSNGEINIWDTSTSTQKYAMKSNSAYQINQLVFSPNSDLLALAGEFVEVWDLKTNTLRKIGTTANGGVSSVSFAPNSQSIIIASDEIQVWNLESGELTTKKEQNNWLKQVHFSDDGGYLFTLDENNTVRLWSIKDFELVSEFPNTKVFDQFISFSSNNEFFAIKCSNEIFEICLWNTKEGTMGTVAEKGIYSASGISLSPNSIFLAIGNYKNISIWDTETNTKIASLPSDSSEPTDILSRVPIFSQNSKFLAVVTENKIEFYEYGTWNKMFELNLET